LPKLFAVLATIVIVYLFGLRPLFTLTLGAPFTERVAISIALLAPLGLVLGMFFPLGISALAALDRRLVPWAWATNGSATVVGTILAVIAAVTWDFRRVSIAALVVYGIGVFAFVRGRRRDAAAASAPSANVA
jgi:hypothetical protein